MNAHDEHDGHSPRPVVDSVEKSADHGKARQHRKSHKKSRNGCQYCKRRRIKCDEGKPSCHSCSRLAIPCDYTGLISQSEDGQTPPEMIRKRGRPRKDWTVVSVRSKNGQPSSLERTTSSASSHTSSDQGLEKTLHMPWDAQDIELFFHYTAKVCQDLSPADSSLWKDRVPRLSFRCHGVLHLLLAISAFHLSRQDNFRRDELEQRAEMHLALGLRRSTSLLPTLGVENCVELYVSTILVCICSFAKKPRPGHLVLVTDGSEVAWWELFRGVRVIIESIGISTLFAGELGPFSHYGDQDHVPHHYERVNSVAAEWEDALARVSALVSSTPDYNVRDSCQSALNMMIWCFQDTYGTAANPKLTVDAKFSTIMAWPYCLSDEFIRHLKNKESVPLILLTYFAVIIQELDSVWFIEGWALHILQGVSNLLPSDVHEYVQWPILQQRASASSAAQKANSGQ